MRTIKPVTKGQPAVTHRPRCTALMSVEVAFLGSDRPRGVGPARQARL